MRIIDADEFKEQLKQRYMKAVEWKSKTVYYERADGEIAAFLEAVRTLNNAPTVDAVPVVRCKDCKWADDQGLDGIYCLHLDAVPICSLPDGFCNYGVRKGEQDG